MAFTRKNEKTQSFLSGKRKTKKSYKFPRKMHKSYCKKTSCKKMGFTQKASCRPWKNCY